MTFGAAARLLRRAGRAVARLLPRSDCGDVVLATARSHGLDGLPVEPLIADADIRGCKTKLLVFADGPGATPFISFDYPLRAARQSGKVQLTILTEGDFADLSPIAADMLIESVFERYSPTQVIVSRYGGVGAQGILKACRKRKLSYIMHFDDNLFEVPEALGPSKYARYSEPARRARLRLLTERAKRIYASTDQLAQQLDGMAFTPQVVSGRIYCAMTATPAPYKRPKNPVIGYMGTSGHGRDIDMIVPALIGIMERRADVHFETFGSIKMPNALRQKFPDRVKSTKAAGSYSEFIQMFQGMSWTCGLAPLEDTSFNACKANTKYIEYTLAGMPCVASDTVTYRCSLEDGRGVLVRSIEEWSAAIERIINDAEFGHALVDKAQADLALNWTQAELCQQLVRIAEMPDDLCEC